MTRTRSAHTVLGSAQGILPAALVDGGLLSAAAWVAFIVACLWSIVRGFARSPSNLRLGAAVASFVVVGAGLVSGDRFEMQAWVLLGLALVATATSRGETREIADA